MKVLGVELSTGKAIPESTTRRLLLTALTLTFITILPLCLLKDTNSVIPFLKSNVNDLENECDIFSGEWVPHPEGPYYTNATCYLIIDQQDCMKFGRLDTEYMKWRWRPRKCELPLFSASQFLELVRGKSLAFVGDSVGRNQMNSLLCLLASVAYPEDISHRYSSDTRYFQRWFYADYNFTVATLWSPFLVKSEDADPNGYSLSSLMNLYLDQADEAWSSQVENFDYVIISAGQWFFRPQIHYMDGQVVSCYNYSKDNVTAVTMNYGYGMAFRTAFKTLLNLKKYKGITFLRTFSPGHYENGAYNTGGHCARTRPFTGQEDEFNDFTFVLGYYSTQIEELRKAQKKGRKRGLKFKLLATTESMLLRPDGHPNYNGVSPQKNATIADCVHWCLPGPIDTWNEFLYYMLKREAQRSIYEKLQENA